MLEVKENLTAVLERVRGGKPQLGSMEVLVFNRNITKTAALWTNVTSSKSSVCVVLVIVPVLSC